MKYGWYVFNLWIFPHVIPSPNCLTYCPQQIAPALPALFKIVFLLLSCNLYCPDLLFWSRMFPSLQFSVPKYLHHAAVRTSEGLLYLTSTSKRLTDSMGVREGWSFQKLSNSWHCHSADHKDRNMSRDFLPAFFCSSYALLHLVWDPSQLSRS